MSENIYDNDCAFSEQTISYLYNEISSQDKAAFENHLKTCSFCADETGGFDSTRAAVSLWKENEFDALNTPKIAFSDGQSEKAFSTNVSVVEKKSWLLALQTIFQPRMVLAGGLAAFLIMGGSVFFVRNSAVNNQTSAVGGEGSKQEIYDSPNEPKQAEIAEIQTADSVSPPMPAQKPLPVDASNVGIRQAEPSASRDEKSSSPDKNIRKALRNIEIAASTQNKSATQRGGGAANSLIVQRESNNRKRIPKLSDVEIEDDEETSLRLTDLLDEDGGK